MKCLAAILLAAVGCASQPHQVVRVAALPPAAYAHYLRGQAFAADDNYDDAIIELQAASAAAPDEAHIVVALAEAQAKASQLAAASATITVAQVRFPAEPAVWHEAGLLAVARKDEPEARRNFARAIELLATDETAYLELAASWVRDGDVDKAAQAYRDLVAHVPTSAEGHYRLAIDASAHDDLPRAERELRAVIENDADHLDARIELAKLLRNSNRLPEAIAQVRQAFDRSGQSIDVGEMLVWLLAEADDRAGALDVIALLDGPDASAASLRALAAMEETFGEFSSAIHHLQAAQRLDPDDVITTVALGNALHLGDQLEAAIAMLMTVPSNHAEFATARAIIAEIHLAQGHESLAEAAATPALALYPDDAMLVSVYARALFERGAIAEAKALLIALQKRHADDPSVALLVASAFDAATPSDHTAALAAMADQLLHAPRDPWLLNFSGYLLTDDKTQLARAQNDLAEARRDAPGDPGVLDSWGWLQFRQGHLAEADAALTHANHIASGSPEILLHLALVKAAEGNAADAIALLQQAAAVPVTTQHDRLVHAQIAAKLAVPTAK